MTGELAAKAQPECVLVCVTVQRGCDRLIRRGGEIAWLRKAPLCVLHVCTDKTTMGGEEASSALNYLFGLSHDADAQMSVLYEPDVSKAIVAYAREHGARYLVLGAGVPEAESDMIREIRAALPDVSFEICGG